MNFQCALHIISAFKLLLIYLRDVRLIISGLGIFQSGGGRATKVEVFCQGGDVQPGFLTQKQICLFCCCSWETVIVFVVVYVFIVFSCTTVVVVIEL